MGSDQVIITMPRAAAIQLLGSAISAICEDFYSDGWAPGIENLIPRECLEALRWGNPKHVTRDEAAAFVAIAEALGHWVNRNDAKATGEPEYVPYTPKGEQ